MTPPHDVDPLLLLRYVRGERGTSNTEAISAWLTADPAARVTLDRLTRACQHLGDDIDLGPDAEARAWARLSEQVGLEAKASQPGGRIAARASGEFKARQKNSLAGLLPHMAQWGITAVALGVVVLLASWTIAGWHIGRPMKSVSTYTTSPGQRANITLPDGSTVALSVASRLEVPADYGAGNHTVRLDGEALFTVPHRDRTPFTVMVGGVAVHVLGTSFLARRYTTDRTTLVAVRDGKVAVRSTILVAQQQVRISRDRVEQIEPVDPAQFSFATGILTLNRVPFPVAVEELSRWYDADIRLGDPQLNGRIMSARLKVGSLSDLAETLVVTFHMRVVQDGRVLTIFPR